MTPQPNELVWVRRVFGSRFKLVSARVIEVRPTSLLPYRLRFADGSENQYHESEIVDIKGID